MYVTLLHELDIVNGLVLLLNMSLPQSSATMVTSCCVALQYSLSCIHTDLSRAGEK